MAQAADPVTAKYSVSFTQSASVDSGSILMVTAKIVRQTNNPHFKRLLENTMPPRVNWWGAGLERFKETERRPGWFHRARLVSSRVKSSNEQHWRNWTGQCWRP
jgi:hypothetical protein